MEKDSEDFQLKIFLAKNGVLQPIQYNALLIDDAEYFDK